jgi:phosphoribosylanthranilate isomerase
MTRARVKICGITRLEDARAAALLGADAVGFIFWKPSSRYRSPEDVRAILTKLPSFVASVGVFVDAPLDEIKDAVARSGVDTIQLHGDEPPDLCAALGSPRIIKAFRVDGEASLEAPDAYDVSAILLDGPLAGARGGGRTFDWSILRGRTFRAPLLIAGGLTPENVGDAVRSIRPYGVDVSSGVEAPGGLKDAAKMERFIAAAKEPINP